MPTYEYRCEACKRTFEVEQRITEPPYTTCIRQGCKGTVTKLISASSFMLKGKGWFKDGY
jgi:putative FmdB family regulatory protein